MREQFGVLALGQCGGNIGVEFERMGYKSVYVNSSKEDLDSIKGTHKIHIEGGDGAAKNRKRVLQLAAEHIGDIVEQITTILPQKYIICTFSASGGTGSGLSIPLLTYLTQIGRICIPTIVIPDERRESAKAAENTYNCLAELMSINGLGATFLLDNARGDKFAINGRFAKELDSFINLKNSSVYGVIDLAERKQMLSCSGVANITKLSKAKSTASDVIQGLNENIYTPIEAQIAHYFAISTSNRSLDVQDILRAYKGVYDVFTGISEATTVAMVAGMQFPRKRIEKFRIKFEETAQTINSSMMQQHPDIQPLQGLSIIDRRTIQPTATVNPRDILLGLLSN